MSTEILHVVLPIHRHLRRHLGLGPQPDSCRGNLPRTTQVGVFGIRQQMRYTQFDRIATWPDFTCKRRADPPRITRDHPHGGRSQIADPVHHGSNWSLRSDPEKVWTWAKVRSNREWIMSLSAA